MSENGTPKVQPVLSDETRAMGVAYFMKKDGVTKAEAEANVATVEQNLEDEEALFVALGASKKDVADFIADENAGLQADAQTA
jgi:hypothetical protein